MMAQTASFLESARVAADSLRSSKLRSFLTLLGIILATTTLIAVMSVIHGMDLYIANSVSNMGADGFRIVRMAFIGNFDPKKFLELQRRNPQLSQEEFAFLKSHATMVRELGLQAYHNGSLSNNSLTDTMQVMGGTANTGVLNNMQVADGRFLTETENNKHMAVAVLGNDVRERFYAGQEPVGKTIKIDGRPFTIVGVAKPKGSVFGRSQDGFVLIPVQTFFKMYGSHNGMMFAAMANDQTVLQQAEDEIRMLLRAYRHERPNQDDTFSIVASDALVGAWDRLTGAIAATAVAIVSVFMVVGGVVIMNIMLAVVTERTREIGIRKSLGARRQDILNQFLVESAMLSGLGGLIGVVISYTVALLVSRLTPVPMAVPLMAVLLGVGLSALVGLFFGIYPAQRAAKLDPIVALRAES